MTRKQATEILKRMRETGEAVKLLHHYGENCICSTGYHVYKIHGEYVRGTGAGHWACKNTFADFYEEVRDNDFVKMLPADYYEWGL